MAHVTLVIWDDDIDAGEVMAEFEAEMLALNVWVVPAAYETAFREHWGEPYGPPGTLQVLRISGLESIRGVDRDAASLLRTAFPRAGTYEFSGAEDWQSDN